MAHTVMAYIVMATERLVHTDVRLAILVMAYIVMVYTVMAYIVMAYTVMP